MRNRLWLVVGILILGLLGSGSAWADQVFVCQSCTAPPGGDPNLITNTGAFNVGIEGPSGQNPTLIVVAVYDGIGTPTISFGGGVTAATVGTYGLTSNSLSGFSTGDVFGSLGLTAGGSLSFGNLSSADLANGFAAPSSFTLDVFALNTGLVAGTPITIDESGASLGSFILGYSCQDGPVTSVCANGDVSQSVMTNAGVLTGPHSVPEPGSLALLGMGLFSVAGGLRRRFVKS